MKILYIHMQALKSANIATYKNYALGLRNQNIECAFLLRDINGCEDFHFQCHAFEFLDFRLDRQTKQFILDFQPDFIHIASPRFLTVRVALEALILTNARLIVGHEDDEFFIATREHTSVSPKPQFQLSEVPMLTPEILEKLFSNMGWPFFLREWLGKPTHILSEPLSFALVNNIACGFGGIWDHIRDRLTSTYCKEAVTTPPCLDVQNIKPGPSDAVEKELAFEKFKIPENKKALMLLGSNYSLMYDLDVMLHSFCQLEILGRDDWVLCIAGHNEVLDRHKEIASSHGLSDRILWLGKFDYDSDDLALLFRRSDIVLSPGLQNEFNYLRLPMKNASYMAYGKPLFTFSCGFGESLTDGENCIMTYTDSSVEWAEKLNNMLNDSSLCERIGKKAREFAERYFDYRPVSKNMAKFYRSLKHVSSSVPSREPLNVRLSRLARTGQFKKVKQLGIYGAGKHTQRLLKAAPKGFFDKEIIILDDNPKLETLESFEVKTFSADVINTLDGVLISSDAFEEVMFEKCLPLCKSQTIFRLYTGRFPAVTSQLYSIAEKAQSVEDILDKTGSATSLTWELGSDNSLLAEGHSEVVHVINKDSSLYSFSTQLNKLLNEESAELIICENKVPGPGTEISKIWNDAGTLSDKYSFLWIYNLNVGIFSSLNCEKNGNSRKC